MKLRNYFLFLSIIILTSTNIQAQSGKLVRANKNFERYKYRRAIKLYSDIERKGYKASSELFVSTKKADSYRLIQDLLKLIMKRRIMQADMKM